MALMEPQLPALKRFRFFVSRRLEDGRERFRLHMGDFATMAEAEELLPLVREIYPGAWAGEAPGKRLRSRMAAAAAAPAPVAAPVAAAAAATAARLAVVAGKPAAPLAACLPELKPAMPTAPAAAVPAPAAMPAARAVQQSLPPRATAAQPLDARSNVRQVLALLDDGPGQAASPAGRSANSLSDSQALRILESRDGVSDPEISIMQPEDTGTREMIKHAVAHNAPVAFAVQLLFSVQPIDMARVPPLAIFSAYTLYTVEGSRGGRRWYGLRLGFFGDAISAKQVAHYVRSDFTSVAIVPVSPQERGAAGGGGANTGAPGSQGPRPAASRTTTIDRLPEATAEFKLFDEKDEKAEHARATKLTAQAAAEAAAARKPAAGAPDKGGPVDARARRRPQTLEETLEILGADALKMETPERGAAGRGRGSPARPQKNSAFSRLLDRLAERGR